MKKTIILFLSILVSYCLKAQSLQVDKPKILKIVGTSRELTPQKSYPYYYRSSPHVIADTSITKKGDTTGIHVNNEFLLFRSSIHFKKGSEVLKFIRPEYESVEEYQVFQQYVRDSIAREKLYRGIEDNIVADRYLLVDKKRYPRFDSWQRDLNRKFFPLNWKQRFSYTDQELEPLIYDLYIPVVDRFYNVRAFEDRILNYAYTDHYEQFDQMQVDSIYRFFPSLRLKHNKSNIESVVPTINDPYFWAQRSIANRDQFSVLAEVYNKLLIKSPIMGITGVQTNAFCHWKQKTLQKEFDSQNLPYQVIVTLPTWEDQQSLQVSVPKFTIPERNYTPQWRITIADYRKFTEAIRDSSLREYLYKNLKQSDEALRFLNYKDRYFDEGALEYTEIYPDDRDINRMINSLNYNTRINYKNPEIRQLVNKFDDSVQNLTFTYYSINAFERSQNGLYKKTNWPELRDPSGTIIYQDTAIWYPRGKDKTLGEVNYIGQSSGVKIHEYISRFFHTHQTVISPSSKAWLTQHPESLIQEITYEQARAFYFWKYPIHKAKPGDDWQLFVLPTKQQFEQVQRGENIVIGEEKCIYPKPLFRYVVHVYPKK